MPLCVLLKLVVKVLQVLDMEILLKALSKGEDHYKECYMILCINMWECCMHMYVAFKMWFPIQLTL